MSFLIVGQTITCGHCGMTSHNPNDVLHRYCGYCHIFHESDEQVRLTPSTVQSKENSNMKKQIHNKSAFTLLDLILVAFLIVLVTAGFGFLGFRGINYSDGQRTGSVYKLSKKGLFFKTWEGEMSLNLVTRKDGMMINQIFNFSVSDDKVAHAIEQAAQTNTPCTLKYEQYLMRGYKYGSSSYTVVGVESPNFKQ